MGESDLLYSGVIATAIVLSIWVAALVAATCIFFIPTLFTPHESRTPLRKS